MPTKTHTNVPFVRKTSRDELAPRKAQTLEDGVLSVFRLAQRQELIAWKAGLQGEAKSEPEFLLFLVLICGTQYRVSHAEPVLVLNRIRRWVTSTVPEPLETEVADLLLEALTPNIQRVLRKRGWRGGPSYAPVKVKGRPPETPGAWAATALVDAQLRRAGIKTSAARKHAIALASIVLGRNVAANEFYQARELFTTAADSLIHGIRGTYESALTKIGAWSVNLDPAPSRESLEEYTAWRTRQAHLRYLLAVSGCNEVARDALALLPANSWPRLPGRLKST